MTDESLKDFGKKLVNLILDDIKSHASKVGKHKGYIKVDKVEQIIREYFGDD